MLYNIALKLANEDMSTAYFAQELKSNRDSWNESEKTRLLRRYCCGVCQLALDDLLVKFYCTRTSCSTVTTCCEESLLTSCNKVESEDES